MKKKEKKIEIGKVYGENEEESGHNSSEKHIDSAERGQRSNSFQKIDYHFLWPS